MINVIIVEDNDTIREGLSVLINATHGFRCIATYSDCESLLKHIDDLTPDILLMDIVLPGMSGIDGVKKIKPIAPDLNILMLTIYSENDLVFEALCAGAVVGSDQRSARRRLADESEHCAQGRELVATKKPAFDFFPGHLNHPRAE